jgi:hypothetical protein
VAVPAEVDRIGAPTSGRERDCGTAPRVAGLATTVQEQDGRGARRAVDVRHETDSGAGQSNGLGFGECDGHAGHDDRW